MSGPSDTTSKMGSDELNQRLQESLYLSPEDITANQAGQISERQVSRILGQLQAVWIGVSCLWAITIFPLLILFFVFSDMLIRGVLLIMIGIWLWGFLRAGLSIRQQHSIVRADLEAGKAAVAEGILSKRVEGRNCFLTVGGIEVPVPKAAFDHAPTSQTVALYYLPQSQQILSLAVLGEPTPAAEEEDQTV